MGMYLKCMQFLMETFLNKSLPPDQRVFKAWYAKTFFVVWKESVSNSCESIPDETFKDLKCAADGLVLYLLLLKNEFGDAPVVPYYLGSDICEQCFARVRGARRYAGRRSNLDCVTLGTGLEKINLTSALPGNQPFQIAHTRGAAVMKQAVPLDMSTNPSVLKGGPPIYGHSINKQSLRNSMKKATKACIDDCVEFGFPFFMGTDYDSVPTTTSAAAAGYSEEDSDDSDDDESETMDDEDVDEDPCFVKTSMGSLHLKTAEAIYLNGGKTTFGVKAEAKRFYTNTFAESCPLQEYNSVLDNECCSKVIKKGLKVSLPKFADGKVVTGTVCWLSRHFTPLKSVCREHSANKLPVNAWLLIKGKYVRCAVK